MYPSRLILPSALRYPTYQMTATGLTSALAACYLKALSLHLEDAWGRDVDGGSFLWLVQPCGATGHECYRVMVWCKQHIGMNNKRHDPISDYWYNLRLPCRRSFLRMFKSMRVDARTKGNEILTRMPPAFAQLVDQLERLYPGIITKEIRPQLARYRHHKSEHRCTRP